MEVFIQFYQNNLSWKMENIVIEHDKWAFHWNLSFIAQQNHIISVPEI
jgi:hypothetical protein